MKFAWKGYQIQQAIVFVQRCSFEKGLPQLVCISVQSQSFSAPQLAISAIWRFLEEVDIGITVGYAQAHFRDAGVATLICG